MKNYIVLSYSARPSIVLKRFNTKRPSNKIIHDSSLVKIIYDTPIEIHLNADSLEESLDEMIAIFHHHNLPVLYEKEGLLTLRIKNSPSVIRLLESRGFSLSQKEKAWVFGGCHI